MCTNRSSIIAVIAVLALAAAACSGSTGAAGPAGPPGPQGIQGPAGTVDYTRAILNGTSPQSAAFNITGQGIIGGGLQLTGPLLVNGSSALTCSRVCGSIGSVPTGNVSLYSSGVVACSAGFSLTGCSAYWATNSTCTVIEYPSASSMSGLDDGSGGCHALGFNGSGLTLESCACATCCQLP